MTEILIVTAVIAMLAGLSMPAIRSYVVIQRRQEFASQLRLLSQAFELYRLDCGDYPPDGTPSVFPAGMTPYFEKLGISRSGIDVANDRPLGGKWDWDYKQFGGLTGLSVYQPDVSSEEMAKVDTMLDDGNLNTGRFRSRSQGYIYILEE